tara:strand:- start:7016 stop:7378 length:363 start_codon:yes stop_codon:yes gene_type:complete
MSTLKANAWQNQAGTKDFYPCLAWVSFNPNGVIAILSSGSVSSITDNGAGDYTVNYSYTMPFTNQAVSAIAFNTGATPAGAARGMYGKTETSSSCRIVHVVGTGSAGDPDFVSVTVHGSI